MRHSLYKQPSIILIYLFFGPFPWYFSFFIHSCTYNPSITFLIITDNAVPFALPENVIIVRKRLTQILNLIKIKVGIKLKIYAPYKLCDYKPLYGFLFSDLIEGYDFWGHGDVDVIFGRIRQFMTKEVLLNNDVISIRPEYISGFFSLYRNKSNINSLFKKAKNYLDILSHPKCLGFDECSLLCDDLLDGRKLWDIQPHAISMTHIVQRQHNLGKLNAYFNLHAIEGVPGNLLWNEGRLVYMNRYEVMLYHLVSFKVHPKLKVPSWSIVPNKFFINEFSLSE